MTVGLLVILWMTLSPKAASWPASLDALRSPFHNLMVSVIGTLTILLVGIIVSRREPGELRGFDVIGVERSGERATARERAG